TTSAVVNVIVDIPPTASLTANNTGSTVNLAATAADSDGSISKVEFYRGTTLVATVTGGSFTAVDTVLVGSYTYTVKAYDNQGLVTTSAPVNVTVNAPIFYIHTDHLNTPRLITNSVPQPVWRWDNTEPFGNNVPLENPSDLGTFTCNLR